MTHQEAHAIWRSIWRSINREYGNPGHFGWDWVTLRIYYPQRAAVLRVCARVMETSTLK